MKYLNKSFTVSYGSKEYRDNWDAIFNPRMNKQIYYARWHNNSDGSCRWSLHVSGKEALAFMRECDERNKTISVVGCGWAFTSDYLYNKVISCAGIFVHRSDFKFKKE